MIMTLLYVCVYVCMLVCIMYVCMYVCSVTQLLCYVMLCYVMLFHLYGAEVFKLEFKNLNQLCACLGQFFPSSPIFSSPLPLEIVFHSLTLYDIGIDIGSQLLPFRVPCR